MAPCLKARICEDRPDGHLRGSPCARCFCRLLPSTVSMAAPVRAIRPAARSVPSGTRPGSLRWPRWCRTANSSTRSRIGSRSPTLCGRRRATILQCCTPRRRPSLPTSVSSRRSKPRTRGSRPDSSAPKSRSSRGAVWKPHGPSISSPATNSTSPSRRSPAAAIGAPSTACPIATLAAPSVTIGRVRSSKTWTNCRS